MADLLADDRVSDDNSTTSTLGISGVFTGTGEDVLDYPLILVNIFSNVASATDGLSIQFSSDNSNWDHTDIFTVPANTAKTYSIQRVARYFRIVYTNGPTAQTSFRLQVIFNATNTKASTHRINDSISNEDDAELVTSVLKAEDTDSPGNFNNLKETDGRLLVSQEVVAPAGTTAVDQSEIGGVTSTSGNDLEYTITNGTTLTIQLLQGSAEQEIGGSVVELFEDPNGDKSVLNQIGIPIVVDGAFDTQIIGADFTGDGTRRIVLRRRGFTASSREIAGRWLGFEE